MRDIFHRLPCRSEEKLRKLVSELFANLRLKHVPPHIWSVGPGANLHDLCACLLAAHTCRPCMRQYASSDDASLNRGNLRDRHPAHPAHDRPRLR